MDGLLVACEMDRGGIWVAVSVGCVRGSVYVCVCVGGGVGGVRKVKGTCEILRHVLNKIHISIYIYPTCLYIPYKRRVFMSNNFLPLGTCRELRLIL